MGDLVLVPNGFRDKKEVPVTSVEDHPSAPGIKQVVMAAGKATGTHRFVWCYGPATLQRPGIGKDSKGRTITFSRKGIAPPTKA